MSSLDQLLQDLSQVDYALSNLKKQHTSYQKQEAQARHQQTQKNEFNQKFFKDLGDECLKLQSDLSKFSQDATLFSSSNQFNIELLREIQALEDDNQVTPLKEAQWRQQNYQFKTQNLQQLHRFTQN